jgi:hypothetical protein
VQSLVRFRLEVEPYFSILLPDLPVRWLRAWFLLRNEADALLPLFTGSCPVPHPNREYNVARADLHKLQPVLEIIWGLLQRGLAGEDILWTFFSRGVHPLRQ